MRLANPLLIGIYNVRAASRPTLEFLQKMECTPMESTDVARCRPQFGKSLTSILRTRGEAFANAEISGPSRNCGCNQGGNVDELESRCHYQGVRGCGCGDAEWCNCNWDARPDSDPGDLLDYARQSLETYLRKAVSEERLLRDYPIALRYVAGLVASHEEVAKAAKLALGQIDPLRLTLAFGIDADYHVVRSLIADQSFVEPEVFVKVAELLAGGESHLGSLGEKLAMASGNVAELVAHNRIAGILGGPYNARREGCETFGHDGFGCFRNGPPQGSLWFTCDDTGGCAGQTIRLSMVGRRAAWDVLYAK